jgi:hypothetical protein
MKSKIDVRKQLEAGLALYFTQGKVITKVNAQQHRSRRTVDRKIEVVEIEVNLLPKSLQDKFFDKTKG